MKYGILVKTRPGSMWGVMENWCTGSDGRPLSFDTHEQAQKKAEALNKRLPPVNCFHQYFAAPMEVEQAEHTCLQIGMFR